MNILRTKLSGGIVAEFVPPVRLQPKQRQKVVIICGGLPSSPSKAAYMEFFTDAGFWAFAPRYRGTWESAGEFLKESPEKDVEMVMRAISSPGGVKDLWTGKSYRIGTHDTFVVGSSFGGPAALLLSGHKSVKKVAAISPVTDWSVERRSKAEPPQKLRKFLNDGFGGAYRFSAKNWKKLYNGTFYNPAAPEAIAHKVCGEKVLILHAKDDKVVAWRPVKKYAEEIGAKMILVPTGGHAGRMVTPALQRRIVKFFEA